MNISDWVQTTLRHDPCLGETNQIADTVTEYQGDNHEENGTSVDSINEIISFLKIDLREKKIYNDSINSQSKTRNETEDETEDERKVVTEDVTVDETEGVTEDKMVNVTDDSKVQTQEFESELS